MMEPDYSSMLMMFLTWQKQEEATALDQSEIIVSESKYMKHKNLVILASNKHLIARY